MPERVNFGEIPYDGLLHDGYAPNGAVYQRNGHQGSVHTAGAQDGPIPIANRYQVCPVNFWDVPVMRWQPSVRQYVPAEVTNAH